MQQIVSTPASTRPEARPDGDHRCIPAAGEDPICPYLDFRQEGLTSVVLSLYLSYLCVYPSIHPLINLRICLFMHLSIHISIYLSICLSVCLSIYLSIYLASYLSIYLNVYPSIHLSIYPSIHMLIDVLLRAYRRKKYAAESQTCDFQNAKRLLSGGERPAARATASGSFEPGCLYWMVW